MSNFIIGYIGATALFIWLGGWTGAGIVIAFTCCAVLCGMNKDAGK